MQTISKTKNPGEYYRYWAKHPIVNAIYEDGELDNAINQFLETQEEIFDALEHGATLDDVESILANNLGLEPDYIMNII